MAGRAISTVLIDNDRVRVTRWQFTPGAATGWHVHEWDYVIVPLTAGTLELVEPDGTSDSHLTVGAPYFREAAANTTWSTRTTTTSRSSRSS